MASSLRGGVYFDEAFQIPRGDLSFSMYFEAFVFFRFCSGFDHFIFIETQRFLISVKKMFIFV